jgi:hypothetical protein
MRIRKVDPVTGDAVFGGDQASILRNSPDAVGVLVEARMNLWQEQWYLDRSEGTPYEQQVLGRRTEGLRDAALRARILSTQGVVSLKGYNSVQNRQTRTLDVAAEIQTAYSSDYLAGPSANIKNLTVKVENGR